MQETRTPKGLWTVSKNYNIHKHSLNAVLDIPTLAERIAFIHASLFSPALDTWMKAIKAGYLTIFPAITLKKNLQRNPVI